LYLLFWQRVQAPNGPHARGLMTETVHLTICTVSGDRSNTSADRPLSPRRQAHPPKGSWRFLGWRGWSALCNQPSSVPCSRSSNIDSTRRCRQKSFNNDIQSPTSSPATVAYSPAVTQHEASYQSHRGSPLGACCRLVPTDCRRLRLCCQATTTTKRYT